MFASILAITIALPIIPVEQPDYDTAQDMSIQIYSGIQSPNRDLRAGFEGGAKFEYLLTHPYILRFGLDYSQANVTEPFAPTGRKSSWTLSSDILVYIGNNGMISYLGVGGTYGINNLRADNNALDSLKLNLDVDEVDLSKNFGYRVFVGLRFQERVVFEMSFQQSNPDYVYKRRLTENTYSEQRFEGTFSVARVTLGYLIPL